MAQDATTLLPLLACLLAMPVLAQDPPSREVLRKQVETYPIAGKHPLTNLIRLKVVSGVIWAEIGEEVGEQVQPVRLEVEGSAATWVVTKRSAGRASTYTKITRYDFEARAEECWCTGLTLRDNYLSLLARSGGARNGLSVRLTQIGGDLRLMVWIMEGGARQTLFSASAKSVAQLRAENPGPVRKYLEPALAKLTGRFLFRPGAADVYRVFDTIRPEPAMAQRVARLLIRLGGESFKDREEASRELSGLGAPGVLAVLRFDRSLFSAELKARVDAFLAERSNGAVDSASARQDPHFLVDCLDDEDVKVRAAAKRELENVLKRPLEFDVSLGAEARSAAVDELRGRLLVK